MDGREIMYFYLTSDCSVCPFILYLQCNLWQRKCVVVLKVHRMSRFHLVYYGEDVLIVRSGLCIDLYVFIIVHRFLCEV